MRFGIIVSVNETDQDVCVEVLGVKVMDKIVVSDSVRRAVVKELMNLLWDKHGGYKVYVKFLDEDGGKVVIDKKSVIGNLNVVRMFLELGYDVFLVCYIAREGDYEQGGDR